ITFGFAASTGAATDFHEITNVVAKTLTGGVPVLGLTKTDSTAGMAPVGSMFTYTLTPSILPGAPESDFGSLVVTDTFPTGVTLNGPLSALTTAAWNCG